MVTTFPLRPLSPCMHAAYTSVLWPAGRARDPLPPEVRRTVNELLAQIDTAPEEQLDMIERRIVAQTYWYALRPDEIARATRQHWRIPPGAVSVEHAALILAACGEAGYPITGNGAPDFARAWDEPAPVRGEERERVIWAAARHWARAVARDDLTYVSLGDCRGFLPRPVQYDQPGGMHPGQRAALTFGPAVRRGEDDYMRRHTRRLILVREESRC